MTNSFQPHEPTGNMARASLLLSSWFPFLGRLLLRLSAIPTSLVRNMGLGSLQNRAVIFYNPEELDPMRVPEVAGLLHHLLNHLILRHPQLTTADLARSLEKYLSSEFPRMLGENDVGQ